MTQKTVEQYVAERIQELKIFQRYWQESSEIKPAQFPSTLPEEEWYEQELTFTSSAGTEHDLPETKR